MISASLVTFLSWFTGIVISLAGLIAGWKVVRREVVTPVFSHIVNIRQMSEMTDTLAKLLPKLDVVVKMVLPNGGRAWRTH